MVSLWQYLVACQLFKTGRVAKCPLFLFPFQIPSPKIIKSKLRNNVSLVAYEYFMFRRAEHALQLAHNTYNLPRSPRTRSLERNAFSRWAYSFSSLQKAQPDLRAPHSHTLRIVCVVCHTFALLIIKTQRVATRCKKAFYGEKRL